jgi:hypothetical protein
MDSPNTSPILSTEPLEVINQRLIDRYGKFENGQANYRLVWSEDQFEHRFGEYPKFDRNGNYLGLDKGFCYVPKYKQWMPKQWVLEILLPVPEGNNELISKLTYEPLHGFVNAWSGKPIDPTYRAIEFLIERIKVRAAESVGVKYKDPLIDECDPKIALEVKEAKLKSLIEELFGNENDTTDALSYREGVSMSSTNNKDNDNGNVTGILS